MMLHQRLRAHEAEGRTIRIGSTGAGWLGSGFVAAIRHVPGMQVSIVADPDIEAARDAFVRFGGVESGEVVEASSPSAAADALRSGKRVVTGDPTLASQVEDIDIVTDVTSSPASGAETAHAAIGNGKNVVLINIEADVTVGPALKHEAERAGVLYTVSSGDEPGCLMELWDFVNSLGYTPIVIGKGKNNPLDPSANPDSVRTSAEKSRKDPYQVASYVDGTKTMFELTCVANATGCVPQQPGMMGPEADRSTVSAVFALKEDGGIIDAPNTVDFVQGKSMSGGVFVTVRIEDERISDDLNYLKVGSGKYFTFFRPYHLWFLEAPISIARAFFDRQETLVPLDHPVADVETIAKQDLKAGDRLDDFGGYTFRGRNCRKEDAVKHGALPVGLAPGARMKNNVQTGSVVTWNDVELDERSAVVQLRRKQDSLGADND